MRQSIQFKQGQKRFWSISVLLAALISFTGLGISPAKAYVDESQPTATQAVSQPVGPVLARPEPMGLHGSQDAELAALVEPTPALTEPEVPFTKATLELAAQISPPGKIESQSFLKGSGSAGIKQIILEEFAGTGAGSKAIRVAQCESTLNPKARHVNKAVLIRIGKSKKKLVRKITVDLGLFQLNDGGTAQTLLRRLGYSWDALFNARLNARMARSLWNETHSFARWTCG